MNRTGINEMQIYAMGEGNRTINSTATPIRILRVGKPSKVRESTLRGPSRIVSVSGIVAMKLYPDNLGRMYEGKPLDEVEIRVGRSWAAQVGEPFYVPARDVWETWADWNLELTRREEDEARRRQIQDAREAYQAKEIEHMLSLLTDGYIDALNADRPRHQHIAFEPGIVPRLSIADLTGMLKSARTAALNEAFPEVP